MSHPPWLGGKGFNRWRNRGLLYEPFPLLIRRRTCTSVRAGPWQGGEHVLPGMENVRMHGMTLFPAPPGPALFREGGGEDGDELGVGEGFEEDAGE